MFAVAALMTGNAVERRMEDIFGKNSTELYNLQIVDDSDLANRLMATLTFTIGFVMVTVHIFTEILHQYE